jgi:hypothetical protein
MNCAAQLAVCFCMLATSALGQQIASVDLTHPTEPPKSTGKQNKTVLPKGCEKLLPGVIGDGFVGPPDSEPREIVVEMIKASNQSPAIGSEVQGRVQLRNNGKYPIEIPWSTDPTVAVKGQDPYHLNWEDGNFRVVWQDDFLLKNLTQSLYGSRFAAGSMLMIQPGEWVTAEVKLKLEPEYPIPGRLIKAGEGRLRVEWEQTAGTRDVKNCAVASGFFKYGSYYHQQNPAITIKLH